MTVIASVAGTLPLLLDGLATTLLICAVAMVGAVLIAVPVVAARRWGGVIGRLARAYVLIVRGLPIVILVFLMYFGLPAALGLGRVSAFWVGVVALSLNGGAFVSEVLRAAIDRVPQGQWDAARALALPRAVVWARVIVPQMLPVALPALVGELSFLVKASPVLSLITVVDLTRRSQQVAMETFDPLAPMLAAAVLYFAIIYVLSTLSRALEGRLSPPKGRA
jgi:His/Glu/Gln/Arg/opine family amino acid ABC transporter permease subunit